MDEALWFNSLTPPAFGGMNPSLSLGPFQCQPGNLLFRLGGPYE